MCEELVKVHSENEVTRLERAETQALEQRRALAVRTEAAEMQAALERATSETRQWQSQYQWAEERIRTEMLAMEQDMNYLRFQLEQKEAENVRGGRRRALA